MREQAKRFKDDKDNIVIIDGEGDAFTALGQDFKFSGEESLVKEELDLDGKVRKRYKEMLRVANEEEKAMKNGQDPSKA